MDTANAPSTGLFRDRSITRLHAIMLRRWTYNRSASRRRYRTTWHNQRPPVCDSAERRPRANGFPFISHVAVTTAWKKPSHQNEALWAVSVRVRRILSRANEVKYMESQTEPVWCNARAGKPPCSVYHLLTTEVRRIQHVPLYLSHSFHKEIQWVK